MSSAAITKAATKQDAIETVRHPDRLTCGKILDSSKSSILVVVNKLRYSIPSVKKPIRWHDDIILITK